MSNTFSDEITFGDDSTTTTSAPAPVAIARPHQDVERICPIGAARATADEKNARLVGFNPEPPVYAIGTVVNSIGVENFRSSRSDWEADPTLPELARTFTDLIRDENRADRLVDAPALAMTATGKLLVNGKEYGVTPRAMDGLATHITPGGSTYLKACPLDLRAHNLNHWLGLSYQRDARASRAANVEVVKPKQLTLRTRNGVGKDFGSVYAVTGPRYAAFDVDRVVREAAAGIGGDARGTIKYDGYKMTMDAVFHSNVAPENAVAGEFFKGCIRVSGADDGSGSIKVKLGLWRNLCRNLIIVDFDTVLVGSRRHVGTATIESDVRELMATASERIALVVGKWSEASTEDVLARYDLQDVDQVFRGLVLNDCVRATGVKTEEMVERLHTAWEREPGYSKTAILNAITRAAHETSWNSWADQEDLESAAGELLYQKVWNLDCGDRSAEEVLA